MLKAVIVAPWRVSFVGPRVITTVPNWLPVDAAWTSLASAWLAANVTETSRGSSPGRMGPLFPIEADSIGRLSLSSGIEIARPAAFPESAGSPTGGAFGASRWTVLTAPAASSSETARLPARACRSRIGSVADPSDASSRGAARRVSGSSSHLRRR